MVADAYDAMTSTRSYRQALSTEIAIAELRDKAGTQFHPACTDALIRALERRGRVHAVDATALEPHWEFTPPRTGLGSAGLGDLLPSDAGEWS
jgi:hypothetical protein